jgi:hypothetical protein
MDEEVDVDGFGFGLEKNYRMSTLHVKQNFRSISGHG